MINLVSVDEPWPVPYLFVPKESTVEIHCTARERSYSLFWLIDLANATKNFSLQFINQEEQLNAHNVYQLPQIETPGMPPTARLLINDIQCGIIRQKYNAIELQLVNLILPSLWLVRYFGLSSQ